MRMPPRYVEDTILYSVQRVLNKKAEFLTEILLFCVHIYFTVINVTGGFCIFEVKFPNTS